MDMMKLNRDLSIIIIIFSQGKKLMSMQKCVVSFVQKLYTKEKEKAHLERK